MSKERTRKLRRILREASENGHSSERPNAVPGHERLAAVLHNQKIDHVFCVPGRPLYELLGSCVDAGIRVLSTRHQFGAVLASLAMNYQRRSLVSVAAVSPGPALANALTGVLHAHDNQWPLVLLCAPAEPLSPSQTRGAFQQFAGAEVFQPITKEILWATSAEEFAQLLKKAVELSMAPPRGPVLLQFAQSLLFESQSSLSTRATKPSTADRVGCNAPPEKPSEFRRVAELFREAKRPAVLIGDEAHWLRERNALRRVLDEMQAPFALATTMRSLFGDGSALDASRIRSKLLGRADLVVTVAAPMDWRLRFGAEINTDAGVIELKETEAVNVLTGIALRHTTNHYWLAEVRQLLVQERAQRLQNTDSVNGLSRLARVFSESLPPNALVVLDGNYTLLAATRHVVYKEGQQWLTPGYNGCMGVGVPLALGLKVAEPSRPVVVFTGDTALGFSTMEFESIVRLSTPMTIVVANNGGIGGDGIGSDELERQFLPPNFPDRVTTLAPTLRFDQIMASVGGTGHLVTQIDELPQRMERALSSNQAVCLNVMVE